MLNTILSLITALGTIVSAISIASVFMIYRIGKRDEYLSKIRSSLQSLHLHMNELNNLLNYELSFELVNTLIYSKASHYTIKNLYRTCNKCIKDKTEKEKSIELIEKSLGLFGVSFQCDLAKRYNFLLSDIQEKSIVFYPQYKGLLKFTKACTFLMQKVFNNYKSFLLDEEEIAKVVYDTMVSDNCEWTDYSCFKKELMDRLITVLEVLRIEHSQKDVDDILKVEKMVYSIHIELSDSDWKKLLKQSEKNNNDDSSKDAETIIDDLRDAEKYFRPIMDRDLSAQYTSIIQRIEDRHTQE